MGRGREKWKENERASSNAVRKTMKTARCRYLAAVKWRLNGSLAVSSNLFEYLLSQRLVLHLARNEAARLAFPRFASRRFARRIKFTVRRANGYTFDNGN